jgi:hypothetical protein
MADGTTDADAAGDGSSGYDSSQDTGSYSSSSQADQQSSAAPGEVNQSGVAYSMSGELPGASLPGVDLSADDIAQILQSAGVDPASGDRQASDPNLPVA